MQAYGKKTWLIPDNYLNSVSLNDWNSHESVCVINTGDEDAHIRLKLYFEDRDTMDDFFAECKAQRTHHIRLDRIKSAAGEPIPRDIPYAIMLESDVPLVVQYTRLDTSRRELALMTTMAYPVE